MKMALLVSFSQAKMALNGLHFTFAKWALFTSLLGNKFNGGNNRARTYDPLLVRQMLSQLGYASVFSATDSIITQREMLVNPFFEKSENIFVDGDLLAVVHL